MKSEENISIINDQIGSPTSAEFLSKMVLHILNKYKKYSKCKSLYGVYNIASSESASWYKFAKKFYIIIIIFLKTKLMFEFILFYLKIITP